jgi:hypothetical protein
MSNKKALIFSYTVEISRQRAWQQMQSLARRRMNRANAQRNRDRKRVVVDILQAESDRLTTSNMELKNQNSEIRKVIDIVNQQLKKTGEQHRIQISPAITPTQKTEGRVACSASS